jgi:hypothetical protein
MVQFSAPEKTVGRSMVFAPAIALSYSLSGNEACYGKLVVVTIRFMFTNLETSKK